MRQLNHCKYPHSERVQKRNKNQRVQELKWRSCVVPSVSECTITRFHTSDPARPPAGKEEIKGHYVVQQSSVTSHFILNHTFVGNRTVHAKYPISAFAKVRSCELRTSAGYFGRVGIQKFKCARPTQQETSTLCLSQLISLRYLSCGNHIIVLIS